MENSLIKQLPLITTDMPNEVYHRGEWQKGFISSTTLKNYLVSPKYFQYHLFNPKQINPQAALQGSLYHSILESIVNTGSMDGYKNEFFVFHSPINPKTGEPYGSATKAYKEEYELQMENNGGKTPCTQEDITTAISMVECLLNDCGNTSEVVNYLISIGSAEVSFFTDYKGCNFKFRTDLKTRSKIVDWKSISTEDLHESTITKQIVKMNYGFSAAFYQFFYHEITGEWNDFLWVFQQKTPPYDAVIVNASPWAYSYDELTGQVIKGVSAIEFENVLEKHIECWKQGYFPGAESLIEPMGNYRIMYPQVPTYKRNTVINFF